MPPYFKIGVHRSLHWDSENTTPKNSTPISSAAEEDHSAKNGQIFLATIGKAWFVGFGGSKQLSDFSLVCFLLERSIDREHIRASVRWPHGPTTSRDAC